jgi:hypothetical protein
MSSSGGGSGGRICRSSRTQRDNKIPPSTGAESLCVCVVEPFGNTPFGVPMAQFPSFGGHCSSTTNRPFILW